MQADNETIVLERIYLDKVDPNLMHNDITTIDHALTRPWVVMQTYKRAGGSHRLSSAISGRPTGNEAASVLGIDH